METTLTSPELDMNVLLGPKSDREHGEHGWFIGGAHSYDHLLKNPVVKDWIDTYTSESTRRHKLYQFQNVLKASHLKEPGDLLKLSDVEAKNLIKRVAQFYLQKGKPTWARGLVITMRGFYESHDREIKFKRAERIRTPAAKKIAIEIIPGKSDIYRMADVSGSLRNRAMILSLFQSGVRVGCLCRWTYGMFEKQLYPEIKKPVQVKVTPALDSKLNLYGLGYYVTFLGEEAAKALKDHIEQRKRDAWKPKPSDHIFVTDSSASQGEPLEPESVWEVVKRTAAWAELKPEGVWTHTLRKAFRKVLNATPSIDEDTKEALMGHKLPGSRGSYFDYHDVEEAAEKYLQADWTRNGGNGRVRALEEDVKKWKQSYDELARRLDWIEEWAKSQKKR